jgi:hypothetical protein
MAMFVCMFVTGTSPVVPVEYVVAMNDVDAGGTHVAQSGVDVSGRDVHTPAHVFDHLRFETELLRVKCGRLHAIVRRQPHDVESRDIARVLRRAIGLPSSATSASTRRPP